MLDFKSDIIYVAVHLLYAYVDLCVHNLDIAAFFLIFLSNVATMCYKCLEFCTFL